MKTFLVVLLIVQYATIVIGEAPRSDCLHKVNDARAKFAKHHQVADMNELKYRQSLEKTLKTAQPDDSDCLKPSISHIDNVDIFWNVEDQGTLDTELIAGSNRTIMACMKSQCASTGKNVVSIIVDSSGSEYNEGVPGSECPIYRLPTDNGLCALRRSYHRKGILDDVILKPVKVVCREGGKLATKVANDFVELAEKKVHELAKKGEEKVKKLIKKHGKKTILSLSISIGTTVGAGLGSVVPVYGTAVGGFVGGTVGSIVGAEINAQFEEEVDNVELANKM